jgi:uncharacterized protein (TIGR02246 family)
MRGTRFIVAIGMVVAVAACSGPVAREFGKPDVESIRKVFEEYRVAYNAKDAEKVANLFSGGAVVMPPNASMMRGHQAIRDYFVGRFASGASDVVLEPHDITGSFPLAYASGDYSLKMAPPGVANPAHDRGKFLWIFRETNGKWMMEYLMFSSDLPVAPPAASAK